MKNTGDTFPDFKLQGINEKGEEQEYTKQDILGKYCILYIYPKDDTPGCTLESKNFNDLLPHIEETSRIIGLSRDDIASHKKFQSKYNLQFPLLFDEGRKLIKELDATTKGRFGTETTLRSTFLIDPQGKIVKAWYKVNVNEHVREVLDALKKEVSKNSN